MSKDKYLDKKRRIGGILGAVLLSGFQLYAFIEGLHIGDGFIAGVALWLALFIIQVVGNDFTHDDVFRMGWMFSYVVEVAAGTFAIYNLLEIPETNLVMSGLRWTLAFGLSGVVAFLPERMLMIALSGKPKPSEPVKPVASKPQPLTSPTKSGGGLFTPKPTQLATKYDPLEAREKLRQDYLKEEKRNLG